MTDGQSTQLMTVRDVARHLDVDEKTVYRLAQCGTPPGFKVAGTWRFERSDLEEWINLKKQAAAKQATEEKSLGSP